MSTTEMSTRMLDHLAIALQCGECDAPTFRTLHLKAAIELADKMGLERTATTIRSMI